MNQTKAIRILDKRDHILKPTLGDILEELPEGKDLEWSILFIDGVVHPGHGNFFSEITHQVNDSENGFRVTWEELISISKKFFQIYETIILGSKNIELLHRYENDNEMHNNCEIVLDLIDCAFWNVYSKNYHFLENLRKKFKLIKDINA